MTFEQIKKDRLLIFCCLFFPLFYFIQIHNHRFMLHDFEVYYSAAAKVLNNESFYNQSFGLPSGIFKYSPAAAFLFVPFALLPFFAAATIYFTIVSVLVYMTFQKAYNLILRLAPFLGFNVDPTRKTSVLFVSLLVLLSAIHRELHLGNVNLLLLFLTMLHVEFFINKKTVFSGLILSIMILIKPHFLIFTPMLLFSGGIITLVMGFIFFLLAMFLPIAYYGFERYASLFKEWISTMVNHNSVDCLISTPNTIHYWIFKFVPNTIPSATTILTLLSVGTLVSLLLYFQKRQLLGIQSDSFYPLSAFLLVALIPNVTVTDTEHFLFSLPLIVMLTIRLQQKSWTLFHWLTVVAFILFGFNWFDLWGRRISLLLSESGILGIGNIAIIALSIINIMISKRVHSN